MKSLYGLGRKFPAVAALFVFVIFAVYLFRYSLPMKDFSQIGLIYDLIWLDAWSLAFCFVLAFIWMSGLSRRNKVIFGLAALGVYGFIEISLLFNGTPFSMNAYWGDQKFRLAIITHFKELGWGTDFYYRALPAFYPPLLYYGLALLDKIGPWDSYEMLKVGSQLIYLLGPVLLYLLWRPLLNKTQAWLVVLFTFLVGSLNAPTPLVAPHAFVASVAFVPWWLIWVEQARPTRGGWRFYLVGGLIGGTIFSFYFYPFYLGGFILLLRLTFLRRASFWKVGRFRWSRSLGVLAASAAFSSPYWLPLLWSMMKHGVDQSWGAWHHIDSVGIALMFQQLTVPGLLFLAGMLFAFRRNARPVNRGLLILAASVFPYVLLGSILGAEDSPINLIKARNFSEVLAGPFIGLAAATVLRWRPSQRTRWVAPVLLWLTVMFCCHQFDGFGKNAFVKTARTAYVPTWHTDAEEMAQRQGKVFLSGVEELFSFYPVYAYIAANQHYSHPASRFKERYDLLCLLEPVRNPMLFNLALRHNKYDPVDFFMPRAGESSWDVAVSMSNYPDRFSSRVFHFARELTEDSLAFRREQGDNLYAVLDPSEYARDSAGVGRFEVNDSLAYLMRAAMIRDHLTDEGAERLDDYLEADWSGWRQLVDPEEPWTFGDSLRLIDFRVAPVGDSLCLMFGFDAPRTVSRRYRIMCHISAGDDFLNYDFWPSVPTNTWQKWGTYVERRSIPRPAGDFRCFVGFFDKEVHLPGDFKIDLHAGDLDADRQTVF